MRRSLLAGLLSALLVVGVVGATALVMSNDANVSRAPAGSSEPGKDQRPGSAEKDEKSHGLGPPAWAGGHASKDGRSAGADWKDAWRELTPAQREARMKELAEAHARGMETWGECVSAAGTDRAKRAQCAKPLPPGLAKRRP